MTISDRIKKVREAVGLTQGEFSASIGLKRPNYNNIELGKQLPTIDTLSSIARIYRIRYEWLIDGHGNSEPDVHLNVHPNVHPSVKNVHALGLPDESSSAHPIEVVVDTSGHLLVPIVDIRAAAGEGYINHETITENDVFRLPKGLIRGKNPLCIRIKGPSMAPTFQDGGYVIITFLERAQWAELRDNFVYVVVDSEGKTYIKRVKNRFSGKKGGFLVLTSDNPDKQSHPNFNLAPDEIGFIWNVEMYLTHRMPNIHDQYYTRLSNLESQVFEVQEVVKRLENQVKTNR